ncbi:MAG: malate synthase [Frankiales bacterium]|nr:malate synthase [Frankiales bacterium]
MRNYVPVGQLTVTDELFAFVRDEAIPGSGVDEAAFWAGAERLITKLAPRVSELLARREELQAAIDAYHLAAPGLPANSAAYQDFLRSIGYLVDEPGDFTITTANVDDEIAVQPGPQLVVPLSNARFATNAANARWGSLYDALYGTDVISDDGGKERGTSYNAVRGAEVIRRGREFLDEYFPLADGATHAGVAEYTVDGDELLADAARLADPSQFVGFQGAASTPQALLLRHNALHVEIQLDRSHRIGSTDRAGVKDIVLEAAVTCIMDLEDSVAAVDPADKVAVYRNWLGLMQGTLQEEITKDGRSFVRTLNPDRTYQTPAGKPLVLPGRALLFVRQVGHLMTSEAILDGQGRPVPEGILDALLTGLGSLHDLRGPAAGRNSRRASIYAVKPKMHGPEEVALACEIFAEVETVLGLPPLTIKIGIMDEERRTSANLKACIYAARDRVAFINTGFLDRTGDEIHTSMQAGPVVRKADMRSQSWIQAYEDANVDIGLAAGFAGRAQIGKGMWAAPDNMADMLAQKIGHPQSGASCAWVPSPTAATLHATHYHAVDVAQRQRELTGQRRSTLTELLTLPLGDPAAWSAADRDAELDNNIQGILGYVVRWVDAGIGCSKVPDLGGTPLMEDRATCRISSQHVANWMLHGLIDLAQVDDSLRRMAAVVDTQNAGDPTYLPMAPGFGGDAFRAARDLVLQGTSQPSGYTEPILHRYRIAEKAAATHISAAK